MTVPSVCETAVAHYLSKGITKDVAVGIASVLYHESNLNPVSENNSGTETGGVINPKGSYGIAQWNGPRQGNGVTGLADFAKGKNEPVSALNTQLDFVLTECANSYHQVWAAIQQPGMTYQKFIPIFVNQYERPANEMAEVNDAMSIATPLYALSISPTPLVAPASGGAGSATSAPAPAPSPVTQPAPLGVTFTMDPALIAALAPIVESLAAGLFRALITQLSAQTSGATPTAGAAPTSAPSLDLGSLVTTLVPLLTSQLSTSLPGLIAAEVAKLVPTAPAVKP
jgi:hypothetical protein